MDEQKLYTREEAAEIFNVHVQTISNWIRWGQLRRVSAPGRIVRIPASEIERLTKLEPLPFDEAPEPEEV